MVLGDNAAYMAWLLNEKQMEGKIDLIYIDPPFFTQNKFNSEIKLRSKRVRTLAAIKTTAYSDQFNRSLPDYLVMLASRLYLMRDLLADSGSLFVHLDWHAAHYVKILLDEIFGEKRFVNEIIWHYKSGGVSRRHFARKHDTILFYSKTANYYFQPQQEKSYNRGFKPYRFKGVREYKDERGWYTMVNRKDVWLLPMVGRTSAERTGYVTQKPEALTDRLIDSCTSQGALCADFFGGSGTLAASADRLGRKWISVDNGELACLYAGQRLARAGAAFDFYRFEETEKDQLNIAAIRIDATVEPLVGSEQKRLRVRLVDYRLPEDWTFPVSQEDLPLLRQVLTQEPLLIVSAWSVDLKPDGNIHRPERLLSRDNDGLAIEFEAIGRQFGSIGVAVTDLFGNRSYMIVEPKEFV